MSKINPRPETVEIEIGLKEEEYSYSHEYQTLTVILKVEKIEFSREFKETVEDLAGPFALHIFDDIRRANRNMLLLRRVKN